MSLFLSQQDLLRGVKSHLIGEYNRAIDNLVKIELSNGEEAVNRTVTKYGRIEGLKKWVGFPVKIVKLTNNQARKGD